MSIKERIRSFLPADGFTASVFTLLSGTTLALGVAYLAQPILTRLYTPTSFGLFEAFLAIVTILIPFASLRYEDALMLPEDDEEASHILGLSLVFILIASILSIFLYFAGPAITAWFNAPALNQWLIWVPPVLFAARATKVFELWLTRKKRYVPISGGQASQAGVIAGLRVAMGFRGSPLGLFAGYLAGQTVTMIGYGYMVFKSSSMHVRTAFNRQGMAFALKRYRRFPLFTMPSALLSALITRLPVLLLLFFFTEEVVGYFGRAFALFAIPLSLLGTAISQVFFVEGVEANRKHVLPSFFKRVHAQLILIGLFPTLAIMITGPQVFGFILGKEWTVSGQYLQIIAPWLFLASMASPLTRSFDMLEKQRLDLVASLSMFAIQTASFIAGGMSGDIITCLLYVSIGGCIARMLQLLIIFRITGAKVTELSKDYLSHLLMAAPFLGILFYVGTLDSGLLTTLAFALCGLIYLVLSLKKLH